MSSDGTVQTLTDFESSVEGMAREQLVGLKAHHDQLKAELDEVKEEVRKVNMIIRAVSGKNNKPGRKTGRGKESTWKPSDEKRTAFIEYATGNGNEITTRSTADALGVSDSYAGQLNKLMRDEGVLRLSSMSGTTNIYRSMV